MKTDSLPKYIHAISLLKAYIVWLAGAKVGGEREEEGADGVLIAGVPFRVTLKSDKRATRIRFEITSLINFQTIIITKKQFSNLIGYQLPRFHPK